MIGKAYFYLMELFIYVEVELFIHDDYPKEISATMTSSSSLCRAHELTESHAREHMQMPVGWPVTYGGGA